MDFKEFSLRASAFLQKRCWEPSNVDGELIFSKNYNPTFAPVKNHRFLLDDKEFHKRLSLAFKQTGLNCEVINSMRNENHDTDLIIAGLQIANEYLKNDQNEHRSFYSFQPVTRFNSLDKCGKEDGFLSSFVNIATVDINTSMDEYLERLDNWISIFSSLSLHTSGLQLKLKKIKDDRDYNGAKFNNGMKIKFTYKGLDIGVANLFQVQNKGKEFLVSDFGSSYERLLWCTNGKENFYTPLIPNYEVLYGDKRKNDRVRTATLMTMSGVLPASKGVGSKVRSLLREVTEIGDDRNIARMVKYYYQYYGKFIQPTIPLEQTLRIMNAEVETNRKLLINKENPHLNDSRTIEELCGMKLIQEATGQKPSILLKPKTLEI